METLRSPMIAGVINVIRLDARGVLEVNRLFDLPSTSTERAAIGQSFPRTRIGWQTFLSDTSQDDPSIRVEMSCLGHHRELKSDSDKQFTFTYQV
jgi:hypothetical protein